MIKQDILDLLDIYDDCEFRIHEVVIGLKVVFKTESAHATVERTLGKLTKRKEIVKTSYGVYRSRTNTHV